jgi:hypothetical protein
MRQNDFIFDIEGRRIGTARSTCNDDPDMITKEASFSELGGSTFGLDDSV